MRQVFSALLSASNERKSEESYEVFWTANAFTLSSSCDASCCRWTQGTREVD